MKRQFFGIIFFAVFNVWFADTNTTQRVNSPIPRELNESSNRRNDAIAFVQAVQDQADSMFATQELSNEFAERKEGESTSTSSSSAAASAVSFSTSASEMERSLFYGHIYRDMAQRINELEERLQNAQHELSKKANAMQQSACPLPPADTGTISQALKESVLNHCPEKINNILVRLKNRATISPQAFPRKLLLVGPPGTGKTTMGKAIAADCGIYCVKFDAAAFANTYQNSGTVNLGIIFNALIKRGEPCILIIDELEVFINRYGNKNDTDSDMITLLCTLLDTCENENLPILFIATLNSVANAPSRLTNRFKDNIVELPIPKSMEARKDILDYYIRSYSGVTFDDNISELLAKCTNGFAHRELGALIKSAYSIALEQHIKLTHNSDVEKVTKDDCWQALTDIRTSDSLWNKGKLKELAIKWGPWVSTTSATAFGLYQTYQAYQGRILQERGLASQQAGLAAQLKANAESAAHATKSLLLQQQGAEIQKASHQLSLGQAELARKSHEFAQKAQIAAEEFQKWQKADANKKDGWKRWGFNTLVSIGIPLVVNAIPAAGRAVGEVFEALASAATGHS